MIDRSEIIHENFISRVSKQELPDSGSQLSLKQAGVSPDDLIDLFDSQMMSRLLDIQSRRLRKRNESFYTIGSSGHEGNAVFGKVFRYTDMAFLHYRCAALLIQRSKQLPDQTPLHDILLSFVASRDDPVSGGRHKVLGSHTLLVPPQTSTVASHLPKAMGAAHSVGLARCLNMSDVMIPHDSVILCSFGDASVNHSTALGAINAAAWATYQQSPMPIVFICEDNNIGISVSTPTGWIRANFEGRTGMRYLYCDGLNLLDTYRVASEAVHYAREEQKPVFLHTRMVRLMGQSGSDTETSYRSLAQIESAEAQDPLLHTARILIDNDVLTPDDICEHYKSIETRVADTAEHAIQHDKLSSAAEIMEPIAPTRTDTVSLPLADEKQRQALFSKDKQFLTRPQHMARLINLALADILLQYPKTIVFGEDVSKLGGVYSVTSGLREKFGPLRVMDTLLDEQSILGLAIGLAHNGFLPIPEIQFLAYLHNAEDQVRGEAATLPFLSNGQFSNPMVIRIAGLASQKGTGGHFHNENSLAVFRDIPGIVLACPSNGADAVSMLRTCVALAQEQHRIVIFVEPIALYMTRDLHEPGDHLWESIYRPPGKGEKIAFGEPGIHDGGEDLCIVTYGNGYYLSRQAAKKLEDERGIRSKIVDLRWLVPINEQAVLNAVNSCQHILIVDECRRSGSISEALYTLFAEMNVTSPMARITAEDSFIPIGNAAKLVLPDVERIFDASMALIDREAPSGTKAN